MQAKPHCPLHPTCHVLSHLVLDCPCATCRYLYFLLTLLGTTLTVVYSDFRARLPEDADASNPFTLALPALSTAIVIVPILIGMIVSTRSRMRFKEKWAACITNSHAIVGEIYQYRLRTLEYDTAPRGGGGDDDEGDNEAKEKISATARAKEVHA